MAGGAVEHGVPHISPGKHHLELLVSPVMSWKVLKEHYQLLEIKLLKRIRPLKTNKKQCTHG